MALDYTDAVFVICSDGATIDDPEHIQICGLNQMVTHIEHTRAFNQAVGPPSARRLADEYLIANSTSFNLPGIIEPHQPCKVRFCYLR